RRRRGEDVARVPWGRMWPACPPRQPPPATGPPVRGRPYQQRHPQRPQRPHAAHTTQPRHAAEAHAHHATAPPTKSSSVNSSGGLMGRVKWPPVSLSAITLTPSPPITFPSVPSGPSKLCSASTDRGSDSSRFMKASLHHALATI